MTRENRTSTTPRPQPDSTPAPCQCLAPVLADGDKRTCTLCRRSWLLSAQGGAR